jgi:hypothetical protein
VFVIEAAETVLEGGRERRDDIGRERETLSNGEKGVNG